MKSPMQRMLYMGLVAMLWLITFSLIQAADDPHVIGLWHFNEDEGDVVATDPPDTGLDGVQVSCEWTDGKFDSSALRFNKPGCHVVIPYNEVLDLQEFTIEFWIKYETPPAENVAIMSNRGWDVGDKMTGFTMRDHGGSLYLEILTRGSTTAPGLRVEQWQFVAVSYDENRKVSMYLDGELKREQPIAGEILYKGADLWIGGEPGSNYVFGNTGDVAIDEVRISDIARTSEEIQVAMETGFGQLAVSPSLKLSTTWGVLKDR